MIEMIRGRGNQVGVTVLVIVAVVVFAGIGYWYVSTPKPLSNDMVYVTSAVQHIQIVKQTYGSGSEIIYYTTIGGQNYRLIAGQNVLSQPDGTTFDVYGYTVKPSQLETAPGLTLAGDFYVQVVLY